MNMLGKASERYSKDRLQHLIENNGAHMYASMGYNTFYYSLDALSVDFEALFPVYLHSLVTPKFNKDDFEDTKRRQLKRIRTRKDSWSSYAFYEFKKHFYPGHPYGFPFNGEEERVSKMTVSDIDGFLDPYLNPENMVVTVMGDFDSEMVLKVLERDLGKLNTPKDPFTLSTSLERKANTTAADFSFKIPQDLAAVFVAYDALNFSEDEKSFKLDILDAVLSGMNYPGGRLFNLLRGEGLVYQAHATVQTGIENGYFLIYALTTEDQVARVKEIIFEQIDDIKAGNITQEEFDLGIAQMDYYYKDRTSTLESLSLISATDELYGKGFDFYAKVDPFITRLKRQDVAEIAKELLINPQVYEFLPEDKKSEDKK
jgi:zinc protease